MTLFLTIVAAVVVGHLALAFLVHNAQAIGILLLFVFAIPLAIYGLTAFAPAFDFGTMLFALFGIAVIGAGLRCRPSSPRPSPWGPAHK